jgi:hypothetical protein
MSPVRYELGFISQKTEFFIATAVKPSNHTLLNLVMSFWQFQCGRFAIFSTFSTRSVSSTNCSGLNASGARF